MLNQKDFAKKFADPKNFDDEHSQVNLAKTNPLITCQLCSGIFYSNNFFYLYLLMCILFVTEVFFQIIITVSSSVF